MFHFFNSDLDNIATLYFNQESNYWFIDYIYEITLEKSVVDTINTYSYSFQEALVRLEELGFCI